MFDSVLNTLFSELVEKQKGANNDFIKAAGGIEALQELVKRLQQAAKDADAVEIPAEANPA